MTDRDRFSYPLTCEELERAMRRGRLERSLAFRRFVERLFGRNATREEEQPPRTRTAPACG